jgi:hypothetical protein
VVVTGILFQNFFCYHNYWKLRQYKLYINIVTTEHFTYICHLFSLGFDNYVNEIYFDSLFVELGFTSHRHIIGHMATSQPNCWRKTSCAFPCIISGTNGHLSRTTDVPYSSLTWKNQKSLSGFEHTAVRGKWFEINDLNHSTTDAPNFDRTISDLDKKRT